MEKKKRKKSEINPVLRQRAFMEERLLGRQQEGLASRSIGNNEEEFPTEKQGGITKSEVIQVAKNRREVLRRYHRKKAEKALRRSEQISTRALIEDPPNNNWIPIGPAGLAKGQADTMPIVSGRVRALFPLPGGTRIYVGTANGGVWRSEDTGRTWRSIMDNFDVDPNPNTDDNTTSLNDFADSQACGALAVIPGTNPSNDRIFVGTGEGVFGSAGGSGFSSMEYEGVGPIMSPDGGKTWIREPDFPSLDGYRFFAMAIDPNNPSRIIAATTNGLYRREGTLASATWRQRGSFGTVTSVVASSSGGTTTFYAAEAAGKIYRSSNGSNWIDLGNLPAGRRDRVSRISLAVHPNEPNIIYALIVLGSKPAGYTGVLTDERGNLHGLYRMDRSPTGDSTWHLVQNIPRALFSTDPANDVGQGNYDSCIAIAPDNLNRVYIGGSLVYAATDWSASLYRCDITVNRNATGITGVTANTTHIGNNVHPDVHTLVFSPNDPEKLWVGCDGGVFYTNQASRGNTNIFQSKNVGLQTITMNHMDFHPTEESILFCGSQDNGGIRYTNDELWEVSALGDGGYFVVNWNDPSKVLSTFANSEIRRSTRGGATRQYSDVDISLHDDESVLFYAPLIGTPSRLRGSGNEDDKADIVAFGSERPWISTRFGGSWRSIPRRSYNRDKLGERIRSMVFTSDTKLFVGTMNGEVWKYVATNRNWSSVTRTSLHDQGSTTLVSQINNRPISDIIAHPDPAKDDQIYICIGGTPNAGMGRVWLYDNSDWIDKSGSGANKLEDIQHNALASYMNGGTVQLFVAADIGVWFSPDDGNNWETFSEGLPDSAVIDLKIFHRTTPTELRLLRASTFGRGVYERTIPDTDKAGVELYVRSTYLDQGRYATQLGPNLVNPFDLSERITEVDTPDMKVDVPDENGNYQIPPDRGYAPNLGEFLLEIEDKSQELGVKTGEDIRNRVYVLVHNRGVSTANNVKVYLLRAISPASPPSSPPPSMPAQFSQNIARGLLISDANWETVGIQTIQNVRVGNPQVAAFDLYSNLLPTTDGQEVYLLAMVHHANDNFESTSQVVDPATNGNFILPNRKTTLKKAKVKTFSGTAPVFSPGLSLAGYVGIPASATVPEAPFDPFLAAAFRLNDNLFNQVYAAAQASTFVGNGVHQTLTDPPPFQVCNASTITVNSLTVVPAGVPLVWFAKDRIVINQTITAKGKGAQVNEKGDFGGSGGGGSAAGQVCELPGSNQQILAGGTAGNPGQPLTGAWASRALLMLPMIKGGAAGGDATGGEGGGVIVLCAPVIELQTNGRLDASGEDGTGNGGGGGGGLIVLIATEFINVRDEGDNPNVIVDGGRGSAGAGGKGFVLRKTIR